MVHIYSTNNNILSQEEFEAVMRTREEAAKHLLTLQAKADKEELNTLIKRVNMVKTFFLILFYILMIYSKIRHKVSLKSSFVQLFVEKKRLFVEKIWLKP